MSAALPLPPNQPPHEAGSGLPETLLERLRLIRQTVATEAAALQRASQVIGPSAVRAAELSAACSGSVVVTGVGKAGLVGQKLVATLASTGTPAHFLHPTEAIHGDFGRVKHDDLVWALSNSGRSAEVTQIAAQLASQGSGLVSFTADEDNPLAEAADCNVVFGRHPEACPHGLAPTSSTSVMMAVGDAVALLASQIRQFTPRDFAQFHPGGALGRKLSTVGQLMRPIASCRISPQSLTIRDCMVSSSISGRRSGAVMLIDDDGSLTGIFTDSDLARLLESRCEDAFDSIIQSKMTREPHRVTSDTLLTEAIALLSRLRISELPVVDQNGKPVGMIDITDLIALGEVTPPETDRPDRPTIPISS
ncbi:KpsF/GutQ family sugar-phosphate isomerase [Stieleria sp. TO1_6]|uniref:KpsF/GutQ family sugar-phosphate isomerase n=1 Tax=Stieleria tagensis TaxID=2956795 RepID=UPI00209BA6F2|nr:KpsF/GutQ family sugar-phosphate isomerase [Stieleria tagensis]MCO8124412.1 KpsF/GutQ family sugar-phosphate isomerase [Stieleria tagensis]